MNANELAEQLDEYVGNNGYSHNDYADSMSQASTMLRQQQADKEQLEFALINSETAYEKQQAEIAELKVMLGHYEDVYEGVVTHPAELTDKEINPLWRYRKKGEFDQFSYVEWNDEDSFGYEITMFLPTY